MGMRGAFGAFFYWKIKMRKIEFLNIVGEKKSGIFLQWIVDSVNDEGRSNGVHALIEMENGKVEFIHMYDVRFIDSNEGENQ